MAQAAIADRNPSMDAALSDNAALTAQAEKQSADLSKTIEEEKGLAEEHAKRGTELAQTISKARDELRGLTPPKVPDIPDTPQPQYRSPMEAFGSAAGIVATFGSLLTRRPLVNALNASAGVMNAYRAQDRQAYEDAIQTWKLNFEKAKTLHDWQKGLYDEIIAKIDTDTKLAQSEFVAYGTAVGDKEVVRLAEQGLLGETVKLIEFRNTQMDRAERLHQEELNRQERHEEFQQRERDINQRAQEARDAKWTPYRDEKTGKTVWVNPTTPGQVKDLTGRLLSTDEIQELGLGKLSSTAGAKLTPEGLKLAANEYLTFRQMPPLGLGSSEARTAIINEAAKMAGEMGMSPADVAALQAGAASDTGSLRNITRIADSAEAYERTALENMEIVKKLLPEGVGTEYGPALNRWIQTGRLEFGSAPVSKLTTSLVTVANEYAKVMSGSTGAQGSTVDSRREAAELLNQNLNQDQILGNMDIMRQDMDNKKASYRVQRSEIQGRIRGATTPAAPPAANDPLGIR